MTVEPVEYKSVLKTVDRWSPAQRMALIQELLASLASSIADSVPPQNTLEMALGLLADDGPAPSDAQVRAWLDEHRQAKYG